MRVSKELFRFIRQTNRLSQRDLAEKLGVSHSYVALVERGAKPITRNLSAKIVKEFGIDTDYIADASRFIKSE